MSDIYQGGFGEPRIVGADTGMRLTRQNGTICIPFGRSANLPPRNQYVLADRGEGKNQRYIQKLYGLTNQNGLFTARAE